MNRSKIGKRSKGRGYEYEDWLEKHLPDFGFTNTKKQPLSGALPGRPEMAGDLAPTFQTENGNVYDFLVSAKRTAKTSIPFCIDWITEIVNLAHKIDRIPIVMFALYGRPRIINYVVIPEIEYVGMVGNQDTLLICNFKCRGKKYITMKKSVLEHEFSRNYYDKPVALRFEGPPNEQNLLIDLETFIKVI